MGDSVSNYVPRTIQEILSDLSTIPDVSDRASKLDDFINRLEEEMKKIYVFKRELPISIVLMKDAITALKEESILLRGKHVKPVLEQFIPLKKIPDKVVDDDDDINKDKDNKDKKNWLRSAQLWKTDDFSSSSSSGKRHSPDSRVTENAEFGFHPFHSNKNKTGSRTFMSHKGYPFFSAAAAAAARHEQEDADEPISSLSLIMPGTKNSKEQNRPKTIRSRSSSTSAPSSQLNSQSLHHHQPEQQNGRKQRRCWSQELHRRFLNALQQLGGSQVSTPKQIRELMQVDNLTNDEVKSHLQKYRLHTKRGGPVSSIKGAMSNLGESSSMPRDDEEYKVEASKQSNSQSGSPQGPLDLSGTGGNNNSMELGDEISESHSWKNQLHRRSAQDDDEEEEEDDV
ncbi:transcription factor HHO5-like [Impatiens glandulifera]|uniref:transcription factor HHO5-like n=1 Tax=Impatiens glandulifera TaxID=253017 RepID=UPI001FB1906D|nr:transcription factor HHO5-like [Impatiens glandulifera]